MLCAVQRCTARGGREQANETKCCRISNVFIVAERRRGCSSATRVSLVTAGCNAVGGTAAAVVLRN